MEWTKKTWQIALIITVANLLLSGMIAFAVNALSAREKTLQGAATVTYVDSQDANQKCYIDKQDNTATERMNRIQTEVNLKADKDDFDKVYQMGMDNNKLLIDILKEVKTLK
jgi:hypothetical protein